MMISEIRNLRIDNDLTQNEIATILHMSQTGYSKYETGEGCITIPNLIKLADFYGVSTDYLLGLTEKKERNI